MTTYSVNYEDKANVSTLKTFNTLEEAMAYAEKELMGEVKVDDGVDPYTDMADCYKLVITAWDADDEDAEPELLVSAYSSSCSILRRSKNSTPSVQRA